jgi:hypothetical protein
MGVATKTEVDGGRSRPSMMPRLRRWLTVQLRGRRPRAAEPAGDGHAGDWELDPASGRYENLGWIRPRE